MGSFIHTNLGHSRRPCFDFAQHERLLDAPEKAHPERSRRTSRPLRRKRHAGLSRWRYARILPNQ